MESMEETDGLKMYDKGNFYDCTYGMKIIKIMWKQ